MYYSVVWKELLLDQDLMNVGEFCRGCGRPVSKDGSGMFPQGILDCVANDGDHSDIRKLQLLCKSCNGIKNPRSPSIPTTLEMSYSQSKNLLIEPLFRAYVVNKLSENGGSYAALRLVESGAEKYGCSIKAATDYLRKITSDEGFAWRDKDGTVYWDERRKQTVEEWFEANSETIAQARCTYLESKGRREP